MKTDRKQRPPAERSGQAIIFVLLFLIPMGHLALTVAAGVHHPVSALVIMAGSTLMAANCAVHGLTWGILAKTPGSDLAGAATFLALSWAGCLSLCLIPFVLAGLRILRRED